MKKIKLFTLLILILGITSCNSSLPIITSQSSSNVEVGSFPSSEDSSFFSEESFEGELLSFTLDKNSCPDSLFSYQDNYGDFYSSTRFEFYRANKIGEELLRLSSYSSITGVDGLPSAFYNVLPIYDIRKVSLTYSTSIETNKNPIIRFGKTRYYDSQEEIVLSTSKNTMEFDAKNANFFSIETISNSLSIKEITIYYTNTNNDITINPRGSGDDEYRINTSSFQEKLEHNESNILLPTKISLIGDSYETIEEKEYTYYDYQEVRNNPSLALNASLIDPVDVANYFITFKTWPANYVYKNNYSEVYKIFKDQTRCISNYSRTDGYARSVPYQAGSNGKPLYYECDIALDDSYSNRNRGVGRLVVWYYGFSKDKGALDYQEELPVVLYTDDHYFSFREYLGDGRFSKNFDAEGNRTKINWSCPKTLLKH